MPRFELPNPSIPVSPAQFSALEVYVLDPVHFTPVTGDYEDEGSAQAAREIADSLLVSVDGRSAVLRCPDASDPERIWLWHARLSYASESAVEDGDHNAARSLTALARKLLDPLRAVERAPRENPASPSPRYLSLSKVEQYVDLARERGVSDVARSPRGFLTAYRKAGGRVGSLSDYWRNRRDNFVKRHMAQVRMRGEALYEKSGKYAGTPTRRHLALIMWAYSPSRGARG